MTKKRVILVIIQLRCISCHIRIGIENGTIHLSSLDSGLLSLWICFWTHWNDYLSLTPDNEKNQIIVRPIKDKDFDYEIVAEHRLTRGTQILGLTSIPCDIRDIDDAAATLIMIDTNLQQRESILLSEKA